MNAKQWYQRSPLMGSEAEPEISTPIKLALFSVLPLPPISMQSPEHSGMLTPPLHTSAAVPFRWEEEPGKPRPCTALITTTQKCLELPPGRLFFDTKLPSPTTVLEGPYMKRPKASSFRMTTKECYGYGSFSRSPSPERGEVGAIVLSKRWQRSKEKAVGGGGWFGALKRRKLDLKGKRSEVAAGDSFVFPSDDSLDRESDDDYEDKDEEEKLEESFRSRASTVKKMTRRIKRAGSFALLSPNNNNNNNHKSQFWSIIYEGLKQVIPWKGKKLKKNGILI